MPPRTVDLKRIDEPPVITFFSPGYESRALRLRALLVEGQGYLTGLLGVNETTYLGVLRHYDWQRLRRVPYGYPHSNPDSQSIYAPARYPPRILAPTRAIVAAAPEALRTALLDGGVALDEQIASFFDLVLVHELAHLFIHRCRLELGTRWLTEFTANYLSYCYLAARQPALARQWMQWAEIQAAIDPVTHRSLTAFDEKVGQIDFTNFNWYQGQFNLKVRTIYAEQGEGFVRALVARFALTPEVVLARVNEMAPSFATWAAALGR